MIDKLDVHLQHYDQELFCGQLLMEGKQVYFKYAKEYIAKGFNLSPFKLTFDQKVQFSDVVYFDHLFGVFYDSLPDGWGQLLMQRYFHEQNIPTNERNILLQLSSLSNTSKGGLIYTPSLQKDNAEIVKTIDQLHKEAMEFYSQDSQKSIDDLFVLGGSSGGARPKIDAWIHKGNQDVRYQENTDPNYELHIVKFKSDTDYEDIAAIEYCYMLMAERAGIVVSPSKLIKGQEGRSYFATKRFDRLGAKRIHTISVSGLLHDNFRNSNIDYGHIMDAAFQLERNFDAYERVLRLAIFNVLAHNKDDHSKNFSFITDRDGKFSLAPAYDLTFSYGINTYRSTAVAGEQRSPSLKNVKALADHFGVKNVDTIVAEVHESIKSWSNFAVEHGVSNRSLEEISKNLKDTASYFFS